MRGYAVIVTLWALVMTAVVLVPDPPPPEEPADEPAAAQEPTRREARSRRVQGRLERRIEELEAALAATVLDDVPEEGKPGPDGVVRTHAQRVVDLLEEERRLEASEDWTIGEAQRIRREMSALLAADATTHVALMELLEAAKDEDAAWELVSLLVDNPFVKSTRSTAATREIQAAARSMLAAPEPHQRLAGLRVLVAYAPPSKEDVLASIAAFDRERDPTAREDMLVELSMWGRGHGLNAAESRPLVESMRAMAATDDGAWAASALAQWSAAPEDFEMVRQRLRTATDGYVGQALLNAFQRDNRLAAARPDEARRVLLDVLQDPARDANVRSLALTFLEDYEPWDDETARAVRSYRAETR